MSASLSQQFYDTFPPEVARAILEGCPLRVHAVRVSLVREADSTGFAIDTLPGEGRPAEWERSTQNICKILKKEVGRLPAKTKTPLAVIARLMPEGASIPLVTLETWLSVRDDGGSWWTVTGTVTLAAAGLPDMRTALERAKKKALREVCKL